MAARRMAHCTPRNKLCMVQRAVRAGSGPARLAALAALQLLQRGRAEHARDLARRLLLRARVVEARRRRVLKRHLRTQAWKAFILMRVSHALQVRVTGKLRLLSILLQVLFRDTCFAVTRKSWTPLQHREQHQLRKQGCRQSACPGGGQESGRACAPPCCSRCRGGAARAPSSQCPPRAARASSAARPAGAPPPAAARAPCAWPSCRCARGGVG